MLSRRVPSTSKRQSTVGLRIAPIASLVQNGEMYSTAMDPSPRSWIELALASRLKVRASARSGPNTDTRPSQSRTHTVSPPAPTICSIPPLNSPGPSPSRPVALTKLPSGE